MIQAALFDLDGLLIDSERVVIEATHHVADRMGLPDLTEPCTRSIGQRFDNTVRIFREYIPDEAVFDVFLAACLEEVDRRYSAGVPLRPMARETLDYLRDLGLPMAIASSSSRKNISQKLETTGLHPFFSAVIGGEDVVNPKPDPEPYQLAAAALGVLPENCAAFEDSDPGTRAAVAAGCRTVQIPDMLEPGPDMAALDRRLAPDLWQALALLQLR